MSLQRTAAVCIDCGGEKLRPLYVRRPKDSNFAAKAPPDAVPGDDNYLIVRCADCGSVFLSPYYFEEAAAVYSEPRYLRGFYPENIHIGGAPPSSERDLSPYGRWLSRRQARWMLRMAGLEPRRSRPKVVEIGCAQGFLVRAFAEVGCEAHGVEISVQALQAQRKGLSVFHGRFEDAPLAPGAFDLVVACYVFEHIVDLGTLCRAICRALAPGGMLLISVPNDLEGLRSFIWHRRPWWLIPPIHVRYFTATSARTIFALHGLRLVRAATTGSVLRTVNPVLAWRLRRWGLGALCGTVAYKALMLGLETVLSPLDYAVTLAGHHDDLVLLIDQGHGPSRNDSDDPSGV